MGFARVRDQVELPVAVHETGIVNVWLCLSIRRRVNVGP